jgi:hypothetical protein
MNWRFTLIDYTTDRNGIRTILTDPGGELYEPIGWVDVEVEIDRDDARKGVFFDYSFSALKYTDMAFSILKAAYDGYGIAAHVELLMEYYCPECADCNYAVFYQARFDFGNYDKVVADFCYVTVPLETASAMLQFNSLYDQKVDLENLIGYDLATPLTDYKGMGQVIALRNKTVVERLLADNTSVGIGDVEFGPQAINYPLYNDEAFTNMAIPTRDSVYGYFHIPFSNVRAVEIYQSFIQYPNIGINASTNMQSVQIAYGGIYNTSNVGSTYMIYRPRLLPINLANLVQVGPVNMQISIKGKYSDAGAHETSSFWTLYLISYITDSNGNRTLNRILYQSPNYNTTDPSTVISFDLEYSNPAYVMQSGEGLWLGIIYTGFFGNNKPTFVFDGANFIKAEASTSLIDTPCKVFFINEIMSRIAENITNGELQVVSDYYGRTDSQPFAAAADGEGSMRVLTKGLIMRGLQARQAVLNAKGGYLDNFNSSQSNILNNVNIFSLSFEDVFNGLDAIDCIGMGLEDDPTRPGKQRLRVDQWDRFFTDDVILTCDFVDKIETKTKSGKFYSQLNFGYSKWETKSYDGLDEFLTKRRYRTTFTTISNTLDKTCNFVTSGYALEYCRRLSGDATVDSEFDNDPFLICVLPLRLQVQQMAWQTPHTIYITGQVIAFPVGAIFNISGSPSNNGSYTVVSCVRNVVATSPSTIYGGDTIITVKESFTPFIGNQGAVFSAVSPRLFETEQGNVSTASGIVDQDTTFMVDPATVYNWRLSPVRNMLRWMKWLLSMYQNPFDLASKFIFTDGDGNYFATGQQADPNGKLENSDIKESQNLSIQIMQDPANHVPIFRLEEDSFSYPMSAADFVAIKANPYGLIKYYHDLQDVRMGWIDKISYSPVSGMAKFTLIPKRT